MRHRTVWAPLYDHDTLRKKVKEGGGGRLRKLATEVDLQRSRNIMFLIGKYGVKNNAGAYKFQGRSSKITKYSK